MRSDVGGHKTTDSVGHMSSLWIENNQHVWAHCWHVNFCLTVNTYLTWSFKQSNLTARSLYKAWNMFWLPAAWVALFFILARLWCTEQLASQSSVLWLCSPIYWIILDPLLPPLCVFLYQLAAIRIFILGCCAQSYKDTHTKPCTHTLVLATQGFRFSI